MEQVRKNFGAIESDYAFFETHVDEIPHNTALVGARLAELSGTIRLLDFGCGEGHFLVPLLERVGIPAERLELSLVEPVEDYRQRATNAVLRFSSVPPRVWPLIEAVPEGVRFDCVVSHHVLYYVEDLARTIDALRARSPRILAVMAAADHPLPLMWEAAFGAVGRPVPFFQSADLGRLLASRGIAHEVTRTVNTLSFENSEENRLRIVRFTFGDRLGEVDLGLCMRFFDPYTVGGRVEMPHPDVLYDIR